MHEGSDRLLRDTARAPGKPLLPNSVRRRKVLAKTASETSPVATHWSVRTMAKAMGISHKSMQWIWREASLKLHLVRRFKISTDPLFEEKVTDIVGQYLNPPDRALVLCVGEKSQIQALGRTQPGLPLKKGRAAKMTHDYIYGRLCRCRRFEQFPATLGANIYPASPEMLARPNG